MIGDEISITILSIESNGQVNIGVSAPKDVLILRSELQKAASINQNAADTAPALLVAELESVLAEHDPSTPPSLPKE